MSCDTRKRLDIEHIIYLKVTQICCLISIIELIDVAEKPHATKTTYISEPYSTKTAFQRL